MAKVQSRCATNRCRGEIALTVLGKPLCWECWQKQCKKEQKEEK